MLAGKCAKIIIIIVAAVFFFSAVFCFFFPLKYSREIEFYAAKYDVDAVLVRAVINAESRFRENASSSAGAVGLAQMMPDTAVWAAEKIGLEKADLNDPRVSIELACWYLSWLAARFSNERAVLAAYNAGSNRVFAWLRDERYSDDGKELRVIPYRETANYVERVALNKRVYGTFFAIKRALAS